MHKNELVAAVAANAGMTKKDAAIVIKAVSDSITEAMAQGEKVQIVGFGTFNVRQRNARTGRNPQTGKTIAVPAARYPAFKACKGLKDGVK